MAIVVAGTGLAVGIDCLNRSRPISEGAIRLYGNALEPPSVALPAESIA